MIDPTSIAAQMAAIAERKAAAYRDLAAAAEAEADALRWQSPAAGTAAPAVTLPEPPRSGRTTFTAAERTARLMSVEALTRPGEFTTYGDLGTVAFDGTRSKPYTVSGAGRLAGDVMKAHPGSWTAPWRVLGKVPNGDAYQVRPSWRDDQGHDARWAQARLEAEGVVFVDGVTDDRCRVSRATLAERYVERHGS